MAGSMMVYMTRADGKWAGFDFGDVSEVEDFWCFIDQASPELWNALPDDAEFSEVRPSECETFVRLDDLVAWADEPNHVRYIVTIERESQEPREVEMYVYDDAMDYAEEVWDEIADGKVCVVRLPDGEVLWSRGF